MEELEHVEDQIDSLRTECPHESKEEKATMPGALLPRKFCRDCGVTLCE